MRSAPTATLCFLGLLLAIALSGCGVGEEKVEALLPEQPAAGSAHQPDPASPLRAFRDLAGTEHRPFADPERKAIVFLFVLHDCPIANAYVPEIHRLYEDFTPRRVAFYLVHADPDLNLAEARQHATEYGIRLPVVLDTGHALAKAAGVTRAPEAAVFAPTVSLCYRGRIDDRFADFGKLRVVPTTRDLRDALGAVLESRPVPQPWPEPVGCFLPVHPAKKGDYP